MKKFLVHRLKELTQLKCPKNPKWFIESMHSLSKFQWHFSQEQKKILKLVRNDKRLQIAKTILNKRNRLESSRDLRSKYVMKLQFSNQPATTGMETNRPMEHNSKQVMMVTLTIPATQKSEGVRIVVQDTSGKS
jgi:hypothetical protein